MRRLRVRPRENRPDPTRRLPTSSGSSFRGGRLRRGSCHKSVTGSAPHMLHDCLTHRGCRSKKEGIILIRKSALTALSALALAVIAGCGQAPVSMPVRSTSTLAPTPSASAAASETQLIAVARQIWFGPGGNSCSRFTIASCPVTARLANRIQEIEQPPSSGPGPVNSWCRCQDSPDPSFTAEAATDGGVVHVHFGEISVDFLMLGPADDLRVDDTQCTGKGAATSIYAPRLMGCGTATR